LGILLPSFTVEVKQTVTGPSLPSGVILSARRTGDGSGYLLGLLPAPELFGNYSGVPKNQYLILTISDQTFFSFSALLSLNLGRVLGIPIQYKLEGLSVLLPVDTYSVTVTYTVSP